MPPGDKDALMEACGSEEVADEILKALKMSMGQASFRESHPTHLEMVLLSRCFI